MSAHTIRVEIEDGGLYFRLHCPYNRTDKTRLCWPLMENGEPVRADETECVYQSWANNVCPDEWHTGLVTIECDATFDWRGDEPTVTLTNPRALPGESIGEKT